jgi:hypothetical protein
MERSLPWSITSSRIESALSSEVTRYLLTGFDWISGFTGVGFMMESSVSNVPYIAILFLPYGKLKSSKMFRIFNIEF